MGFDVFWNQMYSIGCKKQDTEVNELVSAINLIRH